MSDNNEFESSRRAIVDEVLARRPTVTASSTASVVMRLAGAKALFAANEQPVPHLPQALTVAAAQSVVPNTEIHFGNSAAATPLAPPAAKQPYSQQTAPQQPPRLTEEKAGVRYDPESKEILRFISQDFVLLATKSGAVAYHIDSTDELGKEGFKQFCTKHYGAVLGTVGDKEVRLSSGEVWWNWDDPERRVVRRVVMEPTSKAEHEDPGLGETFNRWHVLKHTMVEPDPTATMDDIRTLADHLMYLSDGDEGAVAFFMNWLAQLYQTPEIKMPTAVLLYSKHGRVGKNLLSRLLSRVFGEPLVLASGTSKILTSRFHDSVLHKRLIFINEVRIGTKDTEAVEDFKNNISEPTMQFEGKGAASRQIKNIGHYILTSNHPDALPLMENDGRIIVLRCLAERRPDAYYKALVDWIDGAGASAVANVLASWTFPNGWDPFAPVPQTEAARAMQRAARGHGINWLEDRIAERAGCFAKQIGRCNTLYTQLATENPTYEASMRAFGINAQTMPGMLSKLGYVQLVKRGKAGKTPTNPNYKVWCWANPEFWDPLPVTVWNDYIGNVSTPEGIPPFEDAGHE